MDNTGFSYRIAVCGKTPLPDIRQGSEVKITYYFIEDGHLDKSFDADGKQNPIPVGKKLCYGQCSSSGINNSPHTPANPLPSNGAINQNLSLVMSWTGGDPDGDEVAYDVFFDAGNSYPTTKVTDHQNSTSYTPGTLNENTTYYWKVVAFDQHGLSTAGPVWSFTTE